MATLMLATPGTTISADPEAVIRQLQDRGWSFEFKYDGIRALVHIDEGTVVITNRTGRDITYRYPDVVEQLAGMSDVILDGEIVCTDGNGRPDFHRVHRRDAQGNAFAARQLAAALPAHFVVFDVLSHDGQDVRSLTYLQRREHLSDLAEELAAHGVVSPPVNDDGAMMWQVVTDMGLEGLVAKRHDSRYLGRRSPAWVKIKRTHTLSALVSGWDAGEGSRAATFGALRLSLLDGQGLVAIGAVGSGFSEADVDYMWGLLTREELPIVVEVAYLEVSPTGQLRQPIFKGIRRDVGAEACSISQLNIQPNG